MEHNTRVFCFRLLNREMEYDGIVLESWSRWAAFGLLHDSFYRNAVSLDYGVTVCRFCLC